jgi:predicted lipoprotein with Yx(FWY)xxD motif
MFSHESSGGTSKVEGVAMKTARRVTTLGPRGLAVGALVGVAVLALAACGSSSSSGSGASATSEPPAATSSSTTAAPSGASATVKTASNAKFGTILVDSAGRTLYTLTNGGQPVACTGACAGVWPPLLLANGATSATPGAGVTGLATTSAAGGTQVTQNGDPLYTFSGDTNAGDANGEGITSFGGTWHVAKPAGSSGSGGTVPPTTSAAGSTTTYGY